MSKQTEALNLALEALEQSHPEAYRHTITAIREALAEQPEQEPVAWNDENVIAYCLKRGIEAAKHIAPQPKEPEQEFITHKEGEDGWSEWVCPDPRGYLLKCCDCGLVHEAQFGVVRYKSETEREDCDMVDDPNLQAVFRMRRSEQWSPEDTAHRAGGLPMEQPAQPEQEPVAWMVDVDLANYQGQSEYRTILAWNAKPVHSGTYEINEVLKAVPLYTTPPHRKPLSLAELFLNTPQRKPLTDEEIWALHDGYLNPVEFARAIEAAHGIKE